MSYILDALRRSQAERDRGQVPGLHAQPELGGLRTGALAAPARGTSWLVLLGVAGLVLGGVLAWLLWRTSAPLAVAPTATPVVPAAPAVATAPAQLAVPTPTTAAPAAATPAPAPLPTVVSAPKTVKPAPSPAMNAAATPSAALPSKPSPAPATPAAPAAPAAAIPVLTADMQRTWPPLVLGGSVWSDNASARFVIFGGQVVREGETTTNGVVVEQISPKAVVLRWRDQRASLPL
jgi:general secretion pathway protein B